MKHDKTRVFVSFDVEHEQPMKELLVYQSAKSDSPFEVVAHSSNEPHAATEWEQRTYSAIAACDAFVVLLGPTTRHVRAVVKEVRIADGLYARGDLDRCLQLISRDEGSQEWAVPGAGPVYWWDWATVKQVLA